MTKDTRVVLLLAIGVVNGKPSLSVLSAEVQVGDCDVSIRETRAAWVYNITAHIMRPQLRGVIAGALEDAVMLLVESDVLQTINELTEQLMPALGAG